MQVVTRAGSRNVAALSPTLPARRGWRLPLGRGHSGIGQSPAPIARRPPPMLQRPRSRGVRLVRRSEPFLMMAVACALIALLATLYLTEDNKAALMTYEINALQNEQSSLLRTQSDLKVQLDQLEALQRIEIEANAQGMVPVQPSATTYIALPPVVDTVAPPPTLARARP